MLDAPIWVPPRLAQAPRYDAFWNAVVSYAASSLPLLNKATATFTVGTAPAAERHALSLSFEGGARLVALPIAFPFQGLVGADLTVEDLPLLPTALRDALEEAMVAIVATFLPEHDQGRLALDRSGPFAAYGKQAGAELRWFRVQLSGLASEPAVFDVGIALDQLAAIFEATTNPRQVWPGLKTHLRRDVDITIGRVVVPIAAAKEIRHGTVIVLDRTDDPSLCQMRVGTTRFDFRAEGQQWLCAEVVDLDRARHDRQDDMTKAATFPTVPEAAEPTGEIDLGLLEVAIDFDLGRVLVPLAEIETWQRGSLVALSALPSRDGVEVTLRANGRGIGRGDLVEIDGRLAVRVTQLTFSR